MQQLAGIRAVAGLVARMPKSGSGTKSFKSWHWFDGADVRKTPFTRLFSSCILIRTHGVAFRAVIHAINASLLESVVKRPAGVHAAQKAETRLFASRPAKVISRRRDLHA